MPVVPHRWQICTSTACVCARVLCFFLPCMCACVISPFLAHGKNALWLEIEVMIVSVLEKKNNIKKDTSRERDKKKNMKRRQETVSAVGWGDEKA